MLIYFFKTKPELFHINWIFPSVILENTSNECMPYEIARLCCASSDTSKCRNEIILEQFCCFWNSCLDKCYGAGTYRRFTRGDYLVYGSLKLVHQKAHREEGDYM